MTGSQLEKAIREMVADVGGICYHAAGVRGQVRHTRGWPDLTIVLPGPRYLLRELKGSGDRVRGDQPQIMATLAALGCDVGVWAELDLQTGRVARELTAGHPVPTLICQPVDTRAGMLVGPARDAQAEFKRLREEGYGELAAQRAVAGMLRDDAAALENGEAPDAAVPRNRATLPQGAQEPRAGAKCHNREGGPS